MFEEFLRMSEEDEENIVYKIDRYYYFIFFKVVYPIPQKLHPASDEPGPPSAAPLWYLF